MTFRWEKGASGSGIPCYLLPLLIILPCLPFVSGSFINFSAQPSRHPQSALAPPSLSCLSPACIIHSVFQRDRLDQGLPNPAALPPLLCSNCSSCFQYPPFCFLQIRSLFILKVQLKMWYLRETLLITGTSLSLIKNGHKFSAAPSTKRRFPP